MTDLEGGGASLTTDPAAGSSTGTDVSLREYVDAILFERRRGEERFTQERDRRYSEVATEREKALKIKETADLAALGLAREIQTYKDEKANELRTQIERERGNYATQSDLKGAVEKLEETIKPVLAYVAGQQGRTAGIGVSANAVVTVVGLLLTALAILVAIYFATH